MNIVGLVGPVGPRDPRRRRRHRCVQCILAHVKCCGLLPCARCFDRGQRCSYSATQCGTILIENGKHVTPKDMSSTSLLAPRAVGQNMQYYDRFFEAFLTTNKFSCAGSDWNQYLRASIGQDAMVAVSITAIGTLHAFQTMQVNFKDERLLNSALNAYQKAVNALRKNLSRPRTDIDLCSTISTTFLLGLFELIYDETGDGWKRHMMYGIARLLDINGPQAFLSAELRSLYREIRLFEISRAVLMSQSTALTKSSWQSLDPKPLLEGQDMYSVEPIFDLMLCCAALAQRIHHCLDGSGAAVREITTQLQSFAADGLILRQRLLDQANVIFTPQQVDYKNDQIVLGQLYYFATAIYLSGVYDYDCIWQDHDIITPILTPALVQAYVLQILELSRLAIYTSNTSYLLLLVPLRIAAARCTTRDQQQQIEDLLLRIQATFAVSAAFLAEIRDLWANRQLSG